MLPFATILWDAVESNPPPPAPPTPPHNLLHSPSPSARSCLNNEVTSPSWPRPRRKNSIVSITMRKKEGSLVGRQMRCPCPSNTSNLQSCLPPPPSPCDTHLTASLPSLSVTLSSTLRGEKTPLMLVNLPFHLRRWAQWWLSDAQASGANSHTLTFCVHAGGASTQCKTHYP